MNSLNFSEKERMETLLSNIGFSHPSPLVDLQPQFFMFAGLLEVKDFVYTVRLLPNFACWDQQSKKRFYNLFGDGQDQKRAIEQGKTCLVRMSAGGGLCVLRCLDGEYVAMCVRDIKPIGLNFPSGLSGSFEEATNPILVAKREIEEELIFSRYPSKTIISFCGSDTLIVDGRIYKGVEIVREDNTGGLDLLLIVHHEFPLNLDEFFVDTEQHKIKEIGLFQNPIVLMPVNQISRFLNGEDYQGVIMWRDQEGKELRLRGVSDEFLPFLYDVGFPLKLQEDIFKHATAKVWQMFKKYNKHLN